MLRIVYISSMKKEYSVDELQEMHRKFCKFNTQNNITGLMIYYDRNIIQYIEGEESIIRYIYEKILNDTRHKNIIKLIEEISIERKINNWNTCFQIKTKHSFLEIVESCINNLQNESLIKLFNIFIKVNIRYI